VFREEPPTGTATDSGPEIVDLGTGEVMVQGWADGSVVVPSGESLVRIPASLILQTADRLDTGIRSIDFNGCFDRFRDAAFRMETMQRYTVDEDEPAIAAWRSGRARPEFSVRTSAWAARLAATTIAGKSWRRVRAVDLPLSEYVRWEMAAYAESSVLGEEIRILTRTSEGPDEDFWLFDAAGIDPFAITMVYDEKGRQGEHRLVSDADTIRSYSDLADATWKAAVPLNEFVAVSRRTI